MKKILLIAYIIDIILVALFVGIIVWWKDNHNMPGLAEMLNIRLYIVYLSVAVIAFVIMTIALVKKRRRCSMKN